MSQWPQITLFQPNNSSIILLLIFGEKENSKIVLALEMSEIKSGCLHFDCKHFRHDDEIMAMIQETGSFLEFLELSISGKCMHSRNLHKTQGIKNSCKMARSCSTPNGEE